MAVVRSGGEQLLLGEWACLGVIYPAPTHGFAVATKLKPGGDVGRVWSLSRPLTYRSIEQLTARGYVRVVGEEPGIAGGNRTIVTATRTGRARLRTWLRTPVEHLRDLRSELLLKLVLAQHCGVDTGEMLDRQHARIAELARALACGATDGVPVDVVSLWREESSQAALRFVERVRATRASATSGWGARGGAPS